MTSVISAEASSQHQCRHLVLYDGTCGLCSRLLQFLVKHDHRRIFTFAPLQSAAGQATVAHWGGEPEDLTSFYVIADFRMPNAWVATKSDAALFVAGHLGWPWKVARAAGILPKPVRDRIYDVIARNRYRVFGRYEQCLTPTEEAPQPDSGPRRISHSPKADKGG